MQDWMYWAAGALVVYFFFRKPAPAAAVLSPAEVKDWITSKKGLQLVDVRSPGEFKGGHLAASKLIPLGELDGRLGELNPKLPLIVYCRSGMRSSSALGILLKKGFPDAKHLRGGISAWQGAGLPLAK